MIRDSASIPVAGCAGIQFSIAGTATLLWEASVASLSTILVLSPRNQNSTMRFERYDCAGDEVY